MTLFLCCGGKEKLLSLYCFTVGQILAEKMFSNLQNDKEGTLRYASCTKSEV